MVLVKVRDGYLETDQDLTDDQVEQLRAAWLTYYSDHWPTVLLDGPIADAWREWASL